MALTKKFALMLKEAAERYRVERLTVVRADLWLDQISEKALARRDFINACFDEKTKALTETLAYLHAHPLT